MTDATDNLRSAFLELASRFDLQSIPRTEWRSLCRGPRRAAYQRILLALAEAARAGTIADQLTFYKAAHATLPLHGPELATLARLLLGFRPVPIEWCDVLIDILAEERNQPTALTGEVLLAIEEATMLTSGQPHGYRRRTEFIFRQVANLGYLPKWLSERTAQDDL